MFDITIFPLTLDTGREQYELPGLYVASAPRRAARLRAQDKLILYCRLLNLMGEPQTAAFTPAQQEEIFKRLGDTYFTTPGSVTAGLRAVVTQLNEFLFHRNRKGGASSQLFGVLNLAVIHGDTLVMAHGGPAHSFLLGSQQPAHYDDSTSGGRGLGLAGQVVPRFYQAALDPGSLLILSSDAPANWNAKTLADGAKLPFDQLRRRLVTGISGELSAAVIRVQPGKGQVSYWRPVGASGVQPPAVPSARSSRASQKVDSAPVSIMPPGEPYIPAVTKPQDVPPSAAVPAAVPEETVPSPIMPAAKMPAAEAPFQAEPEAADAGEPAFAEGPAQIFDSPSALSDFDSAEDQEPELPAEPFSAPEEMVDFSASSEADAPSAFAPADSVLPVDEPAQPLQKSGVFLGDSVAKETPAAASPAPRPAHHDEADTAQAAVPVAAPASRRAEKNNLRRPSRQKAGLLSWLHLPGRKPVSGPLSTASAASQQMPPALPRMAVPAPAVSDEAETAGEPRSENLRRGLASAVRSGRKARARVGSAAAKVLPNQPYFNLSSGVMLSIAIVIPLIVVAVALTVYLRSGYSEKFASKMTMAQQFLAQAQQQHDPIQQRDAWKQVYILVNDALSYEPNNQQARALRRQALSTIDNLEGFVRLDYQPLRDGLGTDVKITRMVATLTGVYLLDSNQGRVYRLQSTADGYSLDPSFNCGPGKAGSQIVTQLIDLAELPVNNQFHADILAIDAGGNLVYCSSGADGFDSQVLTVPANGWGTIKGITSLGDSLFVLDPKGNAVYRYDGENGIFNNGPHLYFDTDIPHMSDVVDLAVDQEFLYLLHDNGQMTVCDSGGVSYAKTKCTDPTPYGDSRPGYEPAPLVFAGSHFVHIQATQPPDPALYALDAKNHAIYHMSLRLLNLQRQYLPQPETDFPLPDGAPSAFVVTPNRRALLAFDNQIYFSPIP